jgi:hypothetical protein
MAAPAFAFTISRAAEMLGEDEQLLSQASAKSIAIDAE